MGYSFPNHQGDLVNALQRLRWQDDLPETTGGLNTNLLIETAVDYILSHPRKDATVHQHEWVVRRVINMPEDQMRRVEVVEVCVAKGECEADFERIRVVPRDTVVVINPN